VTPGVRVVVVALGVLLPLGAGAVVMNGDEPSTALSMAPTTTLRTPSSSPATTVPPAPASTTTTRAVRPATTTTNAPTTVTTARPATTVRPTTTLPPAPAAGNTAADALNLLNRDRTSRGLPALPVRADAQAKAQAWAEKLAVDGRLSHSTLGQGLTQCYSGVGENVAMAPSVAHAEQLLMDDPPHRANILAPRWTAVGVGVARTNGGYMVVQVFVTGC
jgi:uncharacterized protein YkwD